MKPTPFHSNSLPAQLLFWGSQAADDFSREVIESFHGVLTRNMITDSTNPYVGFVSASIEGRPWFDTMWTRDAGVFLRELTQWGYLEQAAIQAECLMKLVRPNSEGYLTFPIYFQIGQPGSGSELDGTGAIIIGLVLLWQRLDPQHSTRKKIESFLTGSQSPIKYIIQRLRKYPLIPGSGEFGGGCGIDGEFYNSVQNNLVRLALSMAERLFRSSGDLQSLAECEKSAGLILENMNRYLRDIDGTWIWTIDPDTLQPDPLIVNHVINQGFGGINGILSMTSDAYGLLLDDYALQVVDASRKTLEKLLAFPKRKAMFEKYGVWTQFDRHGNGYLTGPSYGQGYAAQAMLLLDKTEMAGKAVDFLAEVTRHPLPGNKIDRDSDFFFYERQYLPELLENPATINETGTFYDGISFDQGCGALNLVCVAEPLKIARLIAGIDDHDPEHLRIIPRLPAGWSGYQAKNWPVLTPQGLARLDIQCEQTRSGWHVDLVQLEGPAIAGIQVRHSTETGWKWERIIPS